jgi:hypothetical protein
MSTAQPTDTPTPDPLAVARRHVAVLTRDLAWLAGSAEQAGVIIPAGLLERLDNATGWLAG